MVVKASRTTKHVQSVSDDKKQSDQYKINKRKQSIEAGRAKKEVKSIDIDQDDELIDGPEVIASDEGAIDISGIKEYNFKDIPEHFTMLLIGKRRSGKSILCNHVLHDVGDRFDYVYLFSKTAHLNLDPPYPTIRKENMRSGFDDKLLGSVIESQKKMLEYNKMLPESMRKITKICFVMDDIITDDQIRKSKYLEDIFVLGRHLYISLILIMQTSNRRSSVNSSKFQNVDLVCSFGCSNFQTLDNLSRDFYSMLGHKVGRQLMQTIVNEKPFQTSIAANYIQNTKSYEDFVFKKIADPKMNRDPSKIKLLGQADTKNFNNDRPIGQALNDVTKNYKRQLKIKFNNTKTQIIF